MLLMGSKQRRIFSMPDGSLLCIFFRVLPWSLAGIRESAQGCTGMAPHDSSCMRAVSLLASSACCCCSWATRVLACFSANAWARNALSRSNTKPCQCLTNSDNSPQPDGSLYDWYAGQGWWYLLECHMHDGCRRKLPVCLHECAVRLLAQKPLLLWTWVAGVVVY